MERKHLVKSAEHYFNQSIIQRECDFTYEAFCSLEEAYNHVENSLAFILNKFPEAKAEFERIQSHILDNSKICGKVTS